MKILIIFIHNGEFKNMNYFKLLNEYSTKYLIICLKGNDKLLIKLQKRLIKINPNFKDLNILIELLINYLSFKKIL